jgi:glycerol-3-phosphate dehydrogenase (NAD(P)+)
MKEQVVIVGAGALGAALAKVIPLGNAQVTLWDIDASKCPGGCAPLEALVPAANFIFMCVPSWTMRAAVSQYAALIRPATVVVSLAKGLESPSAKTMHEVCAEALPPGQPVVVMGGAMLADELSTGLPGVAAIASVDASALAGLIELFQGSTVQLVCFDDARSVAFAGVLKNIYAVLIGIGDGLGSGNNVRGWLFAQAVHEMLELGTILHIDQQVLVSVAGVGDLVATGLAATSKNHTAGVALARTGTTDTRSEGIVSLLPLMHLVGPHPSLKLLNALEEILTRGANVRSTLMQAMHERRWDT